MDHSPAIYMGPNYVGGNEDNGDLLQKIHAWTATLTTPNPAAGHLEPMSPWRLLDTHRQVWVSLPWGDCSLLLGPGAQGSVYALQESFPQSCLSSGSFMLCLMATSSKRAYAIHKSAAPRAPVPVAVHCWPFSPQETLKHSSVSVSVESLGPGAHKVCLSPLSVSGGNGVWFETWIHPLLPSCWGFSFALGCRVSLHCHSSTYHLTGVSLTLDMGYILKASPVKHSHCSWPWMWGKCIISIFKI